MKSNVSSALSIVGTFLLLELLAFVSFTLSNSFIVYSAASLAVLIVLLIAYFKQIKVEGISSIGLFIMPLFIFGLINAIGNFNTVMGSSIALRIFIPIGFLCFAILGYVSSISKEFKIKNALLVIYGGLCLLTIISYIYTMIQYTPFYTLIYKDSYIYYNGSRASSPIGATSYVLMGFRFQEVSVKYFTMFPSILFTSVIALFFTDIKSERRNFIIYAVYAFVGFVALLTMPTKMTIITDVCVLIVIVLIALFGKKYIKNPLFSKILFWISIAAILAFVLFFVNAQSSWGAFTWYRNAIAKVSILDILFNTNGLSASYKNILDGCLNFSTWTGHFAPIAEDYQYSSALHLSGFANSFFFDTFITSGLLGFLLFGIVLFFGFKALARYNGRSEDNVREKMLITGYLIVTYGCSFLNHDIQPYVFYGNIVPFYLTGPFLIALFLFGYVLKDAALFKKALEVKKEEVQND